MRITSILLIIGITLIPAFFPVSSEGQATTILTGKDDGKAIAVKVGARFEVHLKQLGAAGYLWHVVDLDGNILKLVESGSEPPGKAQGEAPIGGPILKKWVFEGVGKGQTELRMYQYRPWEGADKASEKFSLLVTVN